MRCCHEPGVPLRCTPGYHRAVLPALRCGHKPGVLLRCTPGYLGAVLPLLRELDDRADALCHVGDWRKPVGAGGVELGGGVVCGAEVSAPDCLQRAHGGGGREAWQLTGLLVWDSLRHSMPGVLVLDPDGGMLRVETTCHDISSPLSRGECHIASDGFALAGRHRLHQFADRCHQVSTLTRPGLVNPLDPDRYRPVGRNAQVAVIVAFAFRACWTAQGPRWLVSVDAGVLKTRGSRTRPIAMASGQLCNRSGHISRMVAWWRTAAGKHHARRSGENKQPEKRTCVFDHDNGLEILRRASVLEHSPCSSCANEWSGRNLVALMMRSGVGIGASDSIRWSRLGRKRARRAGKDR